MVQQHCTNCPVKIPTLTNKCTNMGVKHAHDTNSFFYQKKIKKIRSCTFFCKFVE